MDQIDQTLAQLDTPTARRLIPVLEWLFGPCGDRMPVSALNQFDLQALLWQSPSTAWGTDEVTHHEVAHHEIAWSLADFFDAVGLQRYAAICRSRRTHEIISAWHTDTDSAVRLGAAAEVDSGVRPPTTDDLVFGIQMGPAEARVQADLSSTLERLVVGGELDPGTRSYKHQAIQVATSFLRAPSTTYGGASALAVVRRERATRWVHVFGPRVGASLAGELSAMERVPTTPENLGLALTPVTAVLEAIGEGAILTAAGYLPPKLVVALDDRFAWSESYQGKTPRGEGDVPPLSFLVLHLREQRLLTKRGNTITASAMAKRLSRDPARLWGVTVAPGPRWRPGFEHDALAIMAVLLLRADGSSWAGVVEEATRVLAAKWQPAPDDSLEQGVRWMQLDWYRVGYVLGWWNDTRRLSLSPTGKAAAASLFWSVAAAPA